MQVISMVQACVYQVKMCIFDITKVFSLVLSFFPSLDLRQDLSFSPPSWSSLSPDAPVDENQALETHTQTPRFRGG